MSKNKKEEMNFKGIKNDIMKKGVKTFVEAVLNGFDKEYIEIGGKKQSIYQLLLNKKIFKIFCDGINQFRYEINVAEILNELLDREAESIAALILEAFIEANIGKTTIARRTKDTYLIRRLLETGYDAYIFEEHLNPTINKLASKMIITNNAIAVGIYKDVCKNDKELFKEIALSNNDIAFAVKSFPDDQDIREFGAHNGYFLTDEKKYLKYEENDTVKVLAINHGFPIDQFKEDESEAVQLALIKRGVYTDKAAKLSKDKFAVLLALCNRLNDSAFNRLEDEIINLFTGSTEHLSEDYKVKFIESKKHCKEVVTVLLGGFQANEVLRERFFKKLSDCVYPPSAKMITHPVVEELFERVPEVREFFERSSEKAILKLFVEKKFNLVAISKLGNKDEEYKKISKKAKITMDGEIMDMLKTYRKLIKISPSNYIPKEDVNTINKLTELYLKEDDENMDSVRNELYKSLTNFFR